MRVAAYARVSTDTSDQINSLENQITYFKRYIKNNTAWEFTGIYVDEGITGTSIKRRMGFQKMLTEGCEKKFDLLLTKEISRFARNTLDSIYYTRMLKEFGVGVIFLNDGINTLDADAELRLTIMASIAQEESRKTSVRIKWGQKRRMEQGVVFGRDLLGYSVKAGKMYVDLEQAETVKLIFHKFVHDNKGVYTIAKELTAAGIPTAQDHKEWHGNVILKILKNEKYCGDLVQKKTYTPNYLLQEKKINKGQEDKVYLRDHHEPIIERSLFHQAQKELHRRSKVGSNSEKHSNKHCFSGLIKCGICGASYVARKKTGNQGKEYRYWRCYENVKHGKCQEQGGRGIGCNNSSISEVDLKSILLELINKLKLSEELVNTLLKKIPAKQKGEGRRNSNELYEKESKIIKNKGKRLLNLYLEEIISKEDYIEQKRAMEVKLNHLNSKIKEEVELESHTTKMGEIKGEIDREIGEMNSLDETAIREVLMECISGSVFNEIFVSRLIKCISINNNIITIELKYISTPFLIERITD